MSTDSVPSSQDNYAIDDSDDSAVDWMIDWGKKGAIAGACWGTAEAAFMQPVATSWPLFFPAMRIVGANAALFGTVGVTFAATASAAALVRRRNDYVSYGVGGGAAGLVFGFRTRSWPVATGMCAALGFSAALWKFVGLRPVPSTNE
ncbi:NADH dehydrogenase [ubiquinone] 1 alpha subcomplex subunit 11-like [Oscarella lobularis]|uniref:NADH dehydrogenase [ubiquinone] 1 alpha subcomplex subunit 11-like n=1 Tax=Oscarella lobularis TaxID=121494 RepID=UPI0033143BA3